MRNDLTELVFILDRSGSMGGMVSDTIGGYNSLLQKQRREPGDALITTVLFDDRVEILHDRTTIKGVADITDREYYVRGSTALLDAIGITINKIGRAHKNTLSDECPAATLVVIITDGYENASREYTYQQIKQLVDMEKEKYGWEFLFLGANIDAAREGARFGVDADHAVNFHPDARGARLNYEVVSDAVSSMRMSAMEARFSEDSGASVPPRIQPDWKKSIDADIKRRGRR